MKEEVERKDEGPRMTNSRKRGRVALHGSEPMQTGLASKRMRLAAGHTESEGIAAACKFLDETASSDNNGHQEIDGLSAWTDKAEQCRPLFLLDLFCGTVGVAAAFRSLGGDALGMDHLVDKRRVKGPVAKVDLAQRASQDNILKWIVHGKVDGVMLAPPCGTSSRAREIPLPKHFRLRGGMQPAPMRSDRWPNGLPNLRGVAKLKVQAANKLYAFTRRVIEACIAAGIPFICENPRRSLMWNTDAFESVPEGCHFQNIHACMYGSKRRKSTSFLMNFHAENLLLECNNSHSHLPWGMVDMNDGAGLKFSTSLETEYPGPLCRQLALAFLERMQSQGKQLTPAAAHNEQLHKLGAGTQPRGGRSPILMGEFQFKIEVTSFAAQPPQCIEDDTVWPFQGIPIGAKLISSRNFSEMGEKGEKKEGFRAVYGVFFPPTTFLRRALELEHPLDTPQLVDKSNLKAILFIRDKSVADVKLFRARQLKRFSERAKQLAKQEATLKESLDTDVGAVLASKRLLLFKEMADEAQVGDASLFDELIKGFSLTGPMPESGQFPSKLKPALISVEQLKNLQHGPRKWSTPPAGG